jgi:pimeloyl-ACP methyl ester carboxylesterase
VRGGWGAKRAYLRTSLRLLAKRVPLHLGTQPPRNGDESTTKHIILLHGWGLDASGLQDMSKALQALPQCADRRFWNLTYDTHWTGFEQNAKTIRAALEAQPYAFEDVIFVGYSMGGIVAREMVALGFPCSALLTICSPHSGPMPYLLFPGPRSMAKGSPALKSLNSNPRDIAHRNHYYLFAITFTDSLGFHHTDGIVPHVSALGENLGDVALRHTEHLNYKVPAWYDPHWRGKYPEYMPGVLETVAALIEKRPLDLTPETLRSYRYRTPKKRAPLPKANPGDILLFTRARGLNRMITWFTKSCFYHVGIYEGEGNVVEARPRGVVRRNLNGPDGDRHFEVIPAPEDKGGAALAWAVRQVGDGYDPFDVAVIILEKIFRQWRINYTSHDKYSCGEYVAKAFQHAGVDLFPGRHPGRIVPADYEQYLT